MIKKQPESPQVKEEQEEVVIRQEGEQPGLKQEADSCMLDPTSGQNHSESQTLYLKPDESLEQEESVVNMPVIISVVGAAGADLLLQADASQMSVSHEKSSERCGTHAEFEPTSQSHCRSNGSDRPHVCTTCGKGFARKWNLSVHTSVHTGEKPHKCKICGKHIRTKSNLKKHMRIHTGVNPNSCKMCGKHFRYTGGLTVHIRYAHTGEKINL